MENRLRDILNPDSEYNKQLKEQLHKIQLKMIEDKHCSYCINSHEVPHIEMGKNAGTDTYCDVFNELRLSYPTGQECLFWRLKNDET